MRIFLQWLPMFKYACSMNPLWLPWVFLGQRKCTYAIILPRVFLDTLLTCGQRRSQHFIAQCSRSSFFLLLAHLVLNAEPRSNTKNCIYYIIQRAKAIRNRKPAYSKCRLVALTRRPAYGIGFEGLGLNKLVSILDMRR